MTEPFVISWQRPVPVATGLNGPYELPRALLPNDFAERPLLELLRAAASRTPDAIAVVDSTDRVTFRAFLALVERASGRIATLAPPGAGVAVVAPETIAGLAAALGCLVAGRVCILLDQAQPADRLAAMLLDAAPSATILPTDLAALLAGDAAPCPLDETGPDMPWLVTYTSGSTGRPKGVAMSRYATLCRARSNMGTCCLGPSDRLLSYNSMCNSSSLSRHLAALCTGARLILGTVMAEGPAGFLTRMVRDGCTILVVGPATLRALVHLPLVRQAFSGLRVLRCGGAALLPSDAAAARALVPAACAIDATYASTEAGVVSYWVIPPDFAGDELRLPTGYLLDGQSYAFTDDSELVVRSRCVALGEWQNGRCGPGRMVADSIDSQLRIFHTGDTMRLGDDGLLRFVSRADGQIKINGVRIEPAEIEAAMRREPAVDDAVVVSRPRGAEQALIGYAAAPGADSRVLRRLLSERLQAELPPAMRPSRLVILDQIPRLPSGKVDVRSLPEPPETHYRVPRDEREALLCRLFGELTDSERVGIDDGFFALGGDSLAGMRLVTELQAETGKRCPLHLLYAHPTPAELSAVLDEVQAYTPLVPLRPNGDLPPLFCVHPASGYAVGFRPLAEALPARMPVWGLQARGLEPGETPHKSIAQMAEAYVAAIRSVQARGPYRLLGWSVGGTIAQEMACLIEQQGDSVSLLCVLDTPVVTESVHLKRPGNSAVDARAARHFRAQVVARGLLPPDTPDSWGSRVLEQMRLSRSLVEKHRPESCAAPVLLIRATREPGHAASFAWERLTSGPVARIDVPCLHTELGDAGHVPTIAAAVWERAGP